MLKPLFTWAGGKRRFISRLGPHLEFRKSYVEPFFGGGSVFCYMMNHFGRDRFASITVNDINEEIMYIYRSIQSDYSSLIEETKDIENRYLSLQSKERKEYYNEVMIEYWRSRSSSLLLFLLKTSFNGIWQTNKASGGLFATPFGLGNQKDEFIDMKMIQAWSDTLQGVNIKIGDFSEIEVDIESLVYCDPPYIDSFTDYETGFNLEDQIRLLQWGRELKTSGHKVIIQNKTDGEFFEKQILPHEKIFVFDVTHTAGRRKHIKQAVYSAKHVEEIIIIL